MQGKDPNGVPIILGKKIMKIDPFHVDGLGWLKMDAEFTAKQVLAVVNLIVSLILPRPAHIQFDMKEYADRFDLHDKFTDKKPEIMKELESNEQKPLNS